MKILVVEPSVPVREMLEEVLKKEGFVVDATDSAKVGLSLVRQNVYFMVITNAWSYETSGLAMIRKIRDEDIEYPILIHSARGRWQDFVVGFLAGADDYINFPVYPSDILSRVRKLTSGKKSLESDELLVAQKGMLRVKGSGWFAGVRDILGEQDADWLPENAEKEWIMQEKKRTARREQLLSALAFIYPPIAADSKKIRVITR